MSLNFRYHANTDANAESVDQSLIKHAKNENLSNRRKKSQRQFQFNFGKLSSEAFESGTKNGRQNIHLARECKYISRVKTFCFAKFKNWVIQCSSEQETECGKSCVYVKNFLN